MRIGTKKIKNTLSLIEIPEHIIKIFDENFYLNEYPEVKNFSGKPIYHYYFFGIKEEKFPNEKEKLKKIDEKFYEKEYPNYKKTKLSAIDHYKRYGKKEGKFINEKDKTRLISSYISKYGNNKIQRNKILFENFNGNGFGCNPKYIALEILNRKLPYDLVWLVKNVHDKNFPKGIRLVDYNSDEAFYEYATAKIWISNYRKYPHLKKGLIKKNNQIYIQTWHGSLGIKKLDADVDNFNIPKNIPWFEKSKYESSIWDYLKIGRAHV